MKKVIQKLSRLPFHNSSRLNARLNDRFGRGRLAKVLTGLIPTFGLQRHEPSFTLGIYPSCYPTDPSLRTDARISYRSYDRSDPTPQPRGVH